MKVGEDFIGISTPFYCYNEDGELLIHKRSNNCRDEQGTWDFGGGKLEFGLSPEENVLKEISEEYGCTGLITKKLPYYTLFRNNNGKNTHWLALPFFVKVKKEEAKNNEPESIDEIKWVKLNNLPEPLHQGVKKALALYEKEFKEIMGDM